MWREIIYSPPIHDVLTPLTAAHTLRTSQIINKLLGKRILLIEVTRGPQGGVGS